EDIRAFYRYHATLLEPWDGPAGVVFTDGRVVGATLDRNGLRPLRYAVADDRLVACASEAGALPLPEDTRVRRGRLGPGQMLVVDPAIGIEESASIERRLARKRPYARWLRASVRPFDPGVPVEPPPGDLTPRQVRVGFTREDLLLLLRPSAATGHEPVSSMGDDTALPPLAGRARPVTSFLRQRFAQVTNPPIDHLRERSVMSLTTLLGARAPLLAEDGPGPTLRELPGFVVYPSALAALETTRLDATFDTTVDGLAAALAALEDGVLKGMSKMGISDVASYGGAQLFEAVGLDRHLCERYLNATASTLGGIGFAELEAEALARLEAVDLENPGYVKFRKGGEPHATSPEVAESLQESVNAAHALRTATRTGRSDLYDRFAELVNGREPMEPRDLLELVPAGPPVPLDEVETVA